MQLFVRENQGSRCFSRQVSGAVLVAGAGEKTLHTYIQWADTQHYNHPACPRDNNSHPNGTSVICVLLQQIDVLSENYQLAA